ncbi:glycosyltransferase [Shewanella surugensis]|uniref:Glycosyltransferase n=1 Tax=Shewanella surugensis TaxID=212020 RepID=A0ABT0LDM9_9GAMM|nr:glycosyltransferase [Shewanella surugensis]MCL1125241.1 glycosyltransferase [Shewanella surugensis]
MSSSSILDTLVSNANQHFDLTESRHQDQLLYLADALLELSDISSEEFIQLSLQPNSPLEFQLAVKLVCSRRYILQIQVPLDIGIVYAMWGEHNRLCEKSDHNPNGEDSLNAKMMQLNWICNDSNVNWNLYPVDDGCPYKSYNIAKDIVKKNKKSSKVKVLHLKDGITDIQGPLAKLASLDDSSKGGAIIFGCLKALDDKMDAIIYTDADNSVHLGQLGLILEPFIERNVDVVLGNRKHAESILVKQEERWGIGIKTLRHMQRMVGSEIFSKGIYDTQAAYKLFSRSALEAILAAPTVFDFSFDTDWILASMKEDLVIETIPFAFIDSAAESASVVQGPMSTWLILLTGLVKALRSREVEHDIAMAKVIDEHVKSVKDLEQIINLLPPELMEVSDKELGQHTLMSPESLSKWLTEVKSEHIRIQ